MKFIRTIALFLYAAYCAVWIFSLPLHKREWMLSEPDAPLEGMTFCDLGPDPNADFRPWFAVLPLVPLTVLAIILSWRARRLRPSAWVATALWLGWLAKFYLLAPRC